MLQKFDQWMDHPAHTSSDLTVAFSVGTPIAVFMWAFCIAIAAILVHRFTPLGYEEIASVILIVVFNVLVGIVAFRDLKRKGYWDVIKAHRNNRAEQRNANHDGL